MMSAMGVERGKWRMCVGCLPFLCGWIIPVPLWSVLFQSPENVMELSKQVLLSSSLMCT